MVLAPEIETETVPGGKVGTSVLTAAKTTTYKGLRVASLLFFVFERFSHQMLKVKHTTRRWKKVELKRRHVINSPPL